MTGSSTSKAIPLEQLIALNDEIAALTRAGVPLERGLVDLGKDLPGRLGRMATSLGQRLESGQSLSQVLAQANPPFPPVYRAVVEAGLRSGRLAVALEGIAGSARRLVHLRRSMAVSLIYPLILLALLYGLFLFSLLWTIPVVLDVYQQTVLGGERWVEVILWLGQTANWWAPWPPLLGCLLLGGWWVWAWRMPMAAGRRGRLPLFGSLLHAGRLGTFTEVLALLVEQQVPLDQAVVLAADASGDRRLAEAGRELADRIRRGQGNGRAGGTAAGFPPLLGWMIASGQQQAELSRMLHQAADGYREQAARAAQWMTVYLPILLSAGVGGTATLLYALLALGPWFRLMHAWS